MESVKTKLLVKEKWIKLMMENEGAEQLLNLTFSLDQTSIKLKKKNQSVFSKIISKSLEETLALETKVTDDITNLSGLSGRKYRYMINNVISKMNNAKYLEIGSWLGSTACSAIFKNKLKITCIDNWSQFLTEVNNPKEVFEKNIEKYLDNKSNFTLHNEDFRKIDYKKIGKHNIYLFDGPHHFKDHVEGIILAQPALEDEYILIIDDWNWEQVRSGTNAAIEKLGLRITFQLEIRTTHDNTNAFYKGGFTDWHQGYSFFVIKKKS